MSYPERTALSNKAKMNREKKDIEALKGWFQKEKRQLPWREKADPYRIWVSEIMLQQTQVSVVLPYFERWMKQFPTIETLASASIEEVIKAWEGLGYYSRARNLHLGAQKVVNSFGGNLPSTSDELLKIKGLGLYTANAILAFAFKKRAAAVDGNVRRVLARYYGIFESIDKLSVQKEIQNRAEKLLPDFEPYVVSEALIELGALICQKKPKCASCPLASGCTALTRCATSVIPVRKKPPKILALHRLIIILVADNQVLIKKESLGNVMGDLWQFPYIEKLDTQEAEAWIQSKTKKKIQFLEDLPMIKHGFTRYKAHLYPHIWSLSKPCAPFEGYSWVKIDKLFELPFCAGHRQIQRKLLQSMDEMI